MERARKRDSVGVSHVIYDMVAAGLTPGPRSFHGLIVSHALNADLQGAVRHHCLFSLLLLLLWLLYLRSCFQLFETIPSYRSLIVIVCILN
jgi:hypothetical protein